MSNKKPDIAQVRKYLNGELDARAMFELERAAHNDPMLWDMIKGMEGDDPGHQANLEAINNMIAERVENHHRRVIPLWQRASIAASLLIALGIGGWLFTHNDKTEPVVAKQTPATVKPDKAAVTITDTTVISYQDKKAPLLAQLKPGETVRPAGTPAHEPNEKLMPINELVDVTIKADTVEYKASAYPVRAKASVDEILKKLPGVDVDANGNVTAQGQQIAKARINGKDYFAGDVQTAIKNLPADIVAKIQVVDDYGDQAAKTGIKSGEPSKILNIIAKNSVDKSTVDSMKLRVRGIASARYTKPLYIVDGVPVANFDVKSADVKNISILNDSSAKNIYGARAANGVIIVTTKKAGSTLSEVSIVGSKPVFKQETAAASMSIVKADTLATALDKALQGKLAGVNITTKSKALKQVYVTRTVTGKVTDKNDKVALPGVSVKIKGSNTATITDANGNFKITLPGNSADITLAFIGYETKQIKANSDKLDVALSPSGQALSEVVVTGYGNADKYVSVEDAHPATTWKLYNKYLYDNTTVTDGKTGTVKLSFTVAGDGTISDIKVLNSLRDDLDKRAIEILKNGTEWIGQSDGKPSSVKLKIKFHK